MKIHKLKRCDMCGQEYHHLYKDGNFYYCADCIWHMYKEYQEMTIKLRNILEG